MEIIAKMSSKRAAGDFVLLQVADDCGQVIQKRVTFEDYLEALNGSVTEGEEFATLGTLPKGYFNGAVAKTANSKAVRVSVVVPAGVRPLFFQNEEYMVPFPTLVFFGESNKDGRWVETRCFAIKGDGTFPTGKEKLLNYPFGNVYDSGQICWGGNNLPPAQSMADMDALVALFLGSPTNNDLWRQERFCVALDDAPYLSSQRALLEELKEKKSFPTELLKSVGKMLKDLI